MKDYRQLAELVILTVIAIVAVWFVLSMIGDVWMVSY